MSAIVATKPIEGRTIEAGAHGAELIADTLEFKLKARRHYRYVVGSTAAGDLIACIDMGYVGDAKQHFLHWNGGERAGVVMTLGAPA